MGGRAAEELIFGDISTGAHTATERSTAIARASGRCEVWNEQKSGPYKTLGIVKMPIFMGQAYVWLH